ncbi:MAG: hypothetical protein KatS3mg031_0398 [Chitinophagales bacterium]|nr:MAG: hypothetical protein KatS3mg031_0398 [Chitinophagales bacterium]
MLRALLIIVSMMGMVMRLEAQCPGCTPVDCSANNPDGGLCDTVVIGMANHPLDENISFYMPKQVYTTLLPGGGYVQLDRIQVTAVSGLPLGLSWESNHSANGNQYYPQSGDTVGCVRLCGTPIQADTFPLTVYLLADVTAPVVGQVKNQQQTYSNAVIIILPDTSGGVSTFSVTPFILSSCDSLTLHFQANITNPVNPVTYHWDFGNGQTSNMQTPPAQTYSQPGKYDVSLETTVYAYVIRRVRVIQVNGSWTGDIEELTAFLNAPDLYFKIPEVGYTSSEKTNASLPATWQNLSIPIPVGTGFITIEIYDKDNGPPLGSPDDFLGAALIQVGSGSFLWTDSAGTATNGDIMLNDTVSDVFTDTLNITIGVTPEVQVYALPGDSICGGDTTTLFISGSEIYQYAWFKDSVPLTHVTDTFYSTAEAGVYWVEAVSADGCAAQSDDFTVTVVPYPFTPEFYYNPATGLLYTVNHNSSVKHIQWYKDGMPLSGANTSTLMVTDTGTYQVEFFNALGCSVISPEKHLSALGTAVSEPDKAPFHLTVSGQVLQVSVPSAEGEPIHLSICDLTGRVVYAQTRLMSAGQIMQVPLSHLERGPYIITLRVSEGQTVKKMLMMH